MNRRWLITGGCGFIGTALVRRLLSNGVTGIRVVDDLSVGTREDLAAVSPFTEVAAEDASATFAGVQLLVADVRDEAAARAAVRGVDAIVHLAGNTGVQPSIRDPRLDCTSNVIGTLNYLEAARHEGVRRFVFASSGGTVIGDVEPPIHERMVPRPKSPYGASKSACEGYLSAYHGSFGIDGVALRFGNVYGPGSRHKGSVVARFVRRALAGEPLEIFGDGDQTRDFIYVDDLVDAVVRAATTDGIGGEVFQIATAHETSVNELAEMMLPLLRERVSADVRLESAGALQGEIRRNYSDTTKARQRLGWLASTPLEEGLRRTVDAWTQATPSEDAPAAS